MEADSRTPSSPAQWSIDSEDQHSSNQPLFRLDGRTALVTGGASVRVSPSCWRSRGQLLPSPIS
jgi:hypothetical protein